MGTTMRQPLTPVKGSEGASGLRKANLDHHAEAAGLIIFYTSHLSSHATFPPSGARHAIDFSASDLLPAFCRLRRMGRQSCLHHCQPGRWLWRRPVPGKGRKVRCARRAVLLPVAEFRAGHIVSPGRSGRDHRLGAESRRELRSFGLRRVHRHHLPTLGSNSLRFFRISRPLLFQARHSSGSARRTHVDCEGTPASSGFQYSF